MDKDYQMVTADYKLIFQIQAVESATERRKACFMPR
jgi:hypothetical protein